ncbi:Cyclic nucleotide-gated cation channel beta-1 [Eumeta japonica]|uniref:Cyclic nucleotide-gated cation channel beta-1 n=1 Tax=Eumeta variegata TaxID=151549 RepID=A0A4C1U3A3_EUMVA|nr:Cyclic nucleotide-gated cation channel beta-1 [Eumeta japonica]
MRATSIKPAAVAVAAERSPLLFIANTLPPKQPSDQSRESGACQRSRVDQSYSLQFNRTRYFADPTSVHRQNVTSTTKCRKSKSDLSHSPPRPPRAHYRVRREVSRAANLKRLESDRETDGHFKLSSEKTSLKPPVINCCISATDLMQQVVYPTPQGGVAPGGKAYGSWFDPEPVREHAPSASTNSNMDRKTQLRDDPHHAKERDVYPQKIRLFASSPPPPYLFADEGKKSPIQANKTSKLIKGSQPAGEKMKPSAFEEIPDLETPQSPVPPSPSREKKCRGFFALPELCDPFTPIDPQGCGYICWLLVMTFCYSYNAWCIPLRATFPYQRPDNTIYWMAADYFSDFLCLLDVALVKPRLMYLHEGFWVTDPALTRSNYRKKLQYKFDIISLTPLDILYLYYGTHAVFLRFPRLLKLQTFWEFHQAMDRVLSSPYMVRIGKTLFYIFYLIHLNACAYYAMSVYEGLGSNGWVYDDVGNAYIRCFYFATKTATSIGKNPKPENEMEYLFMTVAWLMGVFVFALLIGQIRDIIATATRAQTEYRKMVDGCTRYLRRLNMPLSLQRRVTAWFSYTWNQQRCFGRDLVTTFVTDVITASEAESSTCSPNHNGSGLIWFQLETSLFNLRGQDRTRIRNDYVLWELSDEPRILNSLPYNMKRDVALAVHMSTLSKVQVFRDCSESLLRDLVLQLRPVSFLPGDVVVRRGDIGHDMYIVKTGECYVMSPDEREVLATLREGSVFGEISLLGIDGARRRTATVRSRGYSSMFALSKADLDHALRYHREAALILRHRADQIMRENAAREADRRASERQARRATFGHGVGSRRLSCASGSSAHANARRRLRCASALSKRRLSSVSEHKAMDSVSLAVECSRVRTPLPTIVFTTE